MIADSTSASSGLTTSSRSVSVLDGTMCSSGMSSPVPGSRYWTRLWWVRSVSSSTRMPGIRSTSTADQRREERQPLAGPLVHAGFAAVGDLLERDVPGFDRAGGGPGPPPCRVVHRPLGDVEVEAAHGCQAVGGAFARAGDLGQAAVG